MTTIVLGASGRIGSIITARARASGLDWFGQARRGPADVVWSGAFKEVPPDLFTEGSTVVNLIGLTQGSEQDLHRINVDFVRDLLRIASDAGVAHIILASSAAVYGQGAGVPFAETATLEPLSPYGASKARMEDVAHRQAAHQAPPAITILRIGNVAGADALIAAAQDHVNKGEAMPLHRFENGRAAIRSYIGPDDLFEVLRACAEPFDGPIRVLNVAHPQPVALDDLLLAYRNHVFTDLKWMDTAAPPDIPPVVTLDTSALRHLVALPSYDQPADAFARQITP